MQWNSPRWREIRDDKLTDWFMGNREAVNCFVMISHIAEVWDDVRDGDQPSIREIESAFITATVDLNYNAFFTEHRQAVLAQNVIILNAWLDSNELVRTGIHDDKIAAYTLRNLGLELVPLFAYLTGGYSNMRKVSMESREFFKHEDFSQWAEGL